MAVPVWPVSVPYVPEGEGATASPSYRPPLTAETEGGTSIMRPRPGPRMTELAWRSIPLTDAQWAAFEQFTRVDLMQGTLIFMMPVFKPGSGFVSRRCQIKNGIYTTDESAVPYQRVSFTLVVFNW